MIATVPDRTILHVDLDAFFAAVEQRDRPELRGRPVIVGGGGPDAARRRVGGQLRGARVRGPLGDVAAGGRPPLPGRRLPAGRRPALPAGQPRRHGDPPPVHAARRADLDRRGVPRRDGRPRLFGDGPTIARRIKDEVRAEVGLTASVGVATTKLVAKIASDLRKPDGLVVVPPGEEAAFLAPLPIVAPVGRRREDGGGPCATTASARSATWRRCPADVVVRRFGKHGASLVDRARGIDADPVHDGDPAKSVGHEHTFDVDTQRPRGHRADAAGHGRRRRRRGCGRPGSGPAPSTVKIRDSSFRTITRQRTLAEPTDMTEPIYRAALELARPEVRGIRVRLLGVTASNLGDREQLALFGDDGSAPPAGGRGRRRPAPPIRRARR